MTRVAVLGAGIMGSGIARTLARKGFDVAVWDGVQEKSRALAGEGITAPETLEATLDGADFIFTVLFDADSILWAFHEGAELAPRNAVWIQCATIGSAGAKELREFCQEQGIKAIEANMMGSLAQAEAGELVYIVGGESDIFETARPLLEAGSGKIVYCGEQIGDGTAVKLACNSWIAFLTAGAAQSVALLNSVGVDPNLWLEVISSATSASPYANLKGGKMIDGDFSVQFAVNALVKDLNLVEEMAYEQKVDRRALGVLRNLYSEADLNGYGNADISAVYTRIMPS